MRAILGKSINWENLVKESIKHGLMPLLYWHLKAFVPEHVPAEILRGLREKFYRNAEASMFLVDELGRLLALFADHGIPALPYKGPVLASAIYGDLALRQCGDLDILIPPEQVLRAKSLLLSRGFLPEFQLTPIQERAYLRSQCEYNFHRADKRLYVEIHWRIVPGFMSVDLDPGRLWDDARQLSIGGFSSPTLGAEDLLLVLCCHGYKHLWERLTWICDVSELVKRHVGIDWNRVMSRAARLGLERILLLGLFLANHFLDAALPVNVRKRIHKDPIIERLAARVWEVLFFRPFDALNPSERIRFYLGSRERIGDKVRFAFRLAVTPKPGDWKCLQLPGILYPLYYPFRIFRLIGTYGLGPVRRWIRPLRWRLGSPSA